MAIRWLKRGDASLYADVPINVAAAGRDIDPPKIDDELIDKNFDHVLEEHIIVEAA